MNCSTVNPNTEMVPRWKIWEVLKGTRMHTLMITSALYVALDNLPNLQNNDALQIQVNYGIGK